MKREVAFTFPKSWIIHFAIKMDMWSRTTKIAAFFLLNGTGVFIASGLFFKSSIDTRVQALLQMQLDAIMLSSLGFAGMYLLVRHYIHEFDLALVRRGRQQQEANRRRNDD